ncbi:MAG: helix-turn-helix transcriptional regulator [bacterium]
MNVKKYFWHLNPKALAEVKKILKDPTHPKFTERLFSLLSRCDNAKEVFKLVRQKDFIKAWPQVRRRFTKTNQAPDFKAWWETVYEQLLPKSTISKQPKGKPAAIFLKTGKFLKEKRLERNISQLDFALQAKMTQPDISAIEAGKKNITLETLIRLCQILDIKNLPLA